VANLSWKLHYVLSGKAGDALLDTYQEERRQHVKRLTGVIQEIGKIIGELDVDKARERDRRLLAEAGGWVKTVPRQDLIPPLECGFLSHTPHPANGTLFPKDGGKGLRVVAPEKVAWWFERHGAFAALVRPDHYVYGVARNRAELDALQDAMAKELKR
jgi:3-(3-hydroxy-phenyl)propionate hydroxylase